MKELNRDEIKYILDLFRDSKGEEFRVQMAGYHLVEFEGKFYYSSTDGIRLILIPQTIFDFEYNTHPRVVNITNYLIPSSKLNSQKQIEIRRLIEVNEDIPAVTEIIECESCKGKGWFEHYGDNYRCKNCDETGDVKLMRMIKNYNYLIQIEKTIMQKKYVFDIMTICNIIGESEFTLVYSTYQNAVFKVGDMIVMIMATLHKNEYTTIQYDPI